MSLDLTHAETADAVARSRRSGMHSPANANALRKQRLLLALVFLLLLAATFGVLDICPIRGY